MEQESIPVHVTNFPELAANVEEHEPEHFVFTTVTLQTVAALAAQGQGPQMILDLDPLRKDFSFWSVDAPIILCHAANQATAQGNQIANFPAPDGAYLAAGQSYTSTGTGRIWAMCQVPTRVSIATTRRGR